MSANKRRKRKLRLGGVAEVAGALYITKSALADRRRNPDFPQPVAELAATPVWDMDDIDDYQTQREQDPFAAYRWENQPGRWDRVAQNRATRRATRNG